MGGDRIDIAAESQSEMPIALKIEKLLGSAQEAFRSRQYGQVIELLADFETAFPSVQDTLDWAEALLTLGPAYLEVGRLDEAQASLKRGVAWARNVADQARLMAFLHELGSVALRRGDVDGLFTYSTEAVRLALYADDGLLMTLPNFCIAYRTRGQNELVHNLLQHLLVHAVRQCEAKSLGIALNQLGGTLFDLGNFYTGLQCFLGSIHFKGCVRNDTGIRISLENLQDCLNRAVNFQQDAMATDLLRRRQLNLRILAGVLINRDRVVVTHEDIDWSRAPRPLTEWSELIHHFRPLCPDPCAGQATFITDEYECAIAELECHPENIGVARAVLEAALIQQFRALADGLAIAALLRGETFSEETWRQQLAASRAPIEAPSRFGATESGHYTGGMIVDEEVTTQYVIPKLPEPDWDTRVYREALVRDSLAGFRRPFGPAKLYDVSIRILGGTVPLWNDIAINHQLKLIGSNFRVIFLGAWDVSRFLMCRAIGAPPPGQLDPRFLFGRVAPLTAHCIGPMFDFVEEYAISPFLLPHGAGLHHEGRAVIRGGILRTLGINQSFGPSLGIGMYSPIHFEELFHILDKTVLQGMPWMDLMWINELRSDLRRFVETPRTRDEIGYVFDFAFDMLVNPGEPLSVRGHTLDSVLKGLLEDEIIALDAEGLYRASRFHEMGEPWDH